jgi:hypothetical protein
VVLFGEVRTQYPDRRQRNGAGGQQVEDHRESPGHSSGIDPIARRVFGEAKDVRAVAEERPVAAGGIERWTRLERGQVGDQLRRRLALTASKRRDAVEKIVIGETRRESEHVRIHAL